MRLTHVHVHTPSHTHTYTSSYVLARIFRVVVEFNKCCLSSIYLILSQEPIYMYVLSERWLIHLRGSYSRPVPTSADQCGQNTEHTYIIIQTPFSNQTEIINNSLSKFHFNFIAIEMAHI